MAVPLSIRLPDATLDRLGDQASSSQIPPRTLAQRYVEEGLRMDEHPLIRFVDGPGGRRARVLGSGLDVWEVVSVVRDNGGDVGAAADYLEVSEGSLRAAIAYYGVYQDEIDEIIEQNEREAEWAESAWRAGVRALGA